MNYELKRSDFVDHYSKARREGLRVYQAAIQANTDPYLPVLEEKVPNLSSLSRLSLGIMPVPLDRVIGSVSRGRSYAFAEGFLPILEGGSEFASKWEQLCESVEQSGVNQPVTVLEYLGYYYAIEGNKRISVIDLYIDGLILRGVCLDREGDMSVLRSDDEFVGFDPVGGGRRKVGRHLDFRAVEPYVSLAELELY